MHLGDVSHVLSDRVRAVFYGGRVGLGRGAEDIGALQRVQAGVGEVVQHRPLTDHWGIDPGEHVKSLGALFFYLNAGENAVRLQVAHRGHWDAGSHHGTGKTAPEVHSGQHVLFGWVKF